MIHFNINNCYCLGCVEDFSWDAKKDQKLLNLLRTYGPYLHPDNPFLDQDHIWQNFADKKFKNSIQECQENFVFYYSRFFTISELSKCILKIQIIDVDSKRYMKFLYPIKK